jgi:hypothetical protein
MAAASILSAGSKLKQRRFSEGLAEFSESPAVASSTVGPRDMAWPHVEFKSFQKSKIEEKPNVIGYEYAKCEVVIMKNTNLFSERAVQLFK